MNDAITLQSIGTVRNSRTEAIDDAWDSIVSVIELNADIFSAQALAGLEEFSHVEIIFHFHRVAAANIQTGARHPRGNPAWPKVGIFAQRGKDRPNSLGLCVCPLVKVEGITITVRGLDAIDGTPVLDIKPWMKGFAPRGDVREPDWAAEIMREYW